jgi:hypothetical protein
VSAAARAAPTKRRPTPSTPGIGPTLELPSVALRSSNLRIHGNGQGAVSTAAYVAELPSLVAEIDAGTIAVAVRTVPLEDVERVWIQPEVPGQRIVLRP